MVIVDTSVWVAYLRPGSHNIDAKMEQLVDAEQAAPTGITELELRRGLRPHEAERVGTLLRSQPYVAFEREDFVEAGALLQQLQKRGITLGVPDTLLAALCLRTKLPLFTLDGDFGNISNLRVLEN